PQGQCADPDHRRSLRCPLRRKEFCAVASRPDDAQLQSGGLNRISIDASERRGPSFASPTALMPLAREKSEPEWHVSPARLAARKCCRNPLVLVGLGIILVLSAAALSAPILAKHRIIADPLAQF